jgi:predicted Rdx family selenoprotein
MKMLLLENWKTIVKYYCKQTELILNEAWNKVSVLCSLALDISHCSIGSTLVDRLQIMGAQ